MLEDLFKKIENNEQIDRQELIQAGVCVVSAIDLDSRYKPTRIHPTTIVGRLIKGMFNFTEANLSGLRLVGSWDKPPEKAPTLEHIPAALPTGEMYESSIYK